MSMSNYASREQMIDLDEGDDDALNTSREDKLCEV